jgi:ubiquinone biosynthesis protein
MDSQSHPDRVEEDIVEFIDRYHGVPLEQLSLNEMIGDMTSVLRRHHLVLPPDLVLMLKAFVTLEGMGRSIDPDFDMASEAGPIVERVLRRHYSAFAVARRAQQWAIEIVKTLGSLPNDLSRLLRTARRGRIEVHVEVNSLKEVSHRLDSAASRLTLGVVTSALIIGSAIVMNVQPGESGVSWFGWLGFGGAALGGLWLLFSIWRSGRED